MSCIIFNKSSLKEHNNTLQYDPRFCNTKTSHSFRILAGFCLCCFYKKLFKVCVTWINFPILLYGLVVLMIKIVLVLSIPQFYFYFSMQRTKKAINSGVSFIFIFFFHSGTLSSLDDFTSTLEMHLKEKKSFPVSDEGQPRGCDGNAGSESNWKQESAALWHELLIQVNNH